jgi:hypothetical protein
VSNPLSSVSTGALAGKIFECSVANREWRPDVLRELTRRAVSENPEIAKAANRTFFREVVERNCDLFDPTATEGYARLFAHVIAQVLPQYSAAELLLRYRRVRQVRRYTGEPKRVCVLSRVTLGADVAVTSVVLSAAKRRFPAAEICFVGPAKNAELFSGDTAIIPLPVAYGRSGLLRERLMASEALRDAVDSPGTLIIDPDSRLTQLGLVPICDEDRYLFFESRAYGGDSDKTLTKLTTEWIGETLGTDDAEPYLAPPVSESDCDITISLGVGENQEKLVGPELEYRAVKKLVSLGASVLIDRGGGGEEAVRVEALADRLGRPANLRLHDGSFAAFADRIARSKLYFGYDSAGQHVAAASAVPLVTVFAGYAAERTFERWKPSGRGPIHIIKADPVPGKPGAIIDQALTAITSAAGEAGLS